MVIKGSNAYYNDQGGIMKISEAKKLHNKDEVKVKKSFNGQEFYAHVCGSGQEIKENGKTFLVFDLFISGGGILKNISHKFLS